MCCIGGGEKGASEIHPEIKVLSNTFGITSVTKNLQGSPHFKKFKNRE